LVGGTASFSNAGTYVKSNPSETRIGIPFANQGSIAVGAGNLHFGSTFSQTMGALVVANGATVQFDLPVTLSAGAVSGSGTLSGNVTNGALLSPGSSVGTLTIQGDLTLLGSSQLLFELGGTTPGVNHDFLSVSSNASLGGTLTLHFVNGAEGTFLSTTNLTIMTAASMSGSFTNVVNGGRLLATNGMSSFQVDMNGTSLVLRNFQAVPEPFTRVLMVVGVGALGVMQRTRKNA
jgi:hypothetical protein